jgi:alpha-tubulin suppressor-like RCC1 family protein
MVSAGQYHTVLLRSDGCAVACGLNVDRQCNIPPLHEAVTYTQLSAGYHIQCFSEVMAVQLFADLMCKASATFHLWMMV